MIKLLDLLNEDDLGLNQLLPKIMIVLKKYVPAIIDKDISVAPNRIVVHNKYFSRELESIFNSNDDGLNFQNDLKQIGLECYINDEDDRRMEVSFYPIK
jgi:hypothetical protein